MKSNRRNVLTMLGLAPAGAMMSTDELIDPAKKARVNAGNAFSKAQFSMALRNLADSIDRDEVQVASLRVDSEMRAGAIVNHNLSVVFMYHAGDDDRTS